ncbi:MAG: RNA methyltransferase [Caldilineaceae bacterium]|nr:RNA methyltransferase [Caldilineaceae bacterium]
MQDARRPEEGYFGIGVYQAKRQENVGVLWRGAYQLGAAFVFTVGARYRPQPSDVYKTWRRLPLFSYIDVDALMAAAPYDCPLVGIETEGIPLPNFEHPAQAIYLLGAEDSGLPKALLERCHRVVSIPAVRSASYNVAQAGTLVMYDRLTKRQHGQEDS